MYKTLVEKIANKHSHVADHNQSQQVQQWMAFLVRLLFPTANQRLSVSQIQESIKKQKNILISIIKNTTTKQNHTNAEQIVQQFTKSIQQIYKLLQHDLNARFKQSDQYSFEQIHHVYPQFMHILHYRFSHWFYVKGFFKLSTLINKIVYGKGQIYIHQSCQIGEGFVLLGNNKIRIGQATVIGKNCIIYDGIILDLVLETEAQINKQAQCHPTIGDNVTIYTGSVILGKTVIENGKNILPNNNILIKPQSLPNSQPGKNKFYLQYLIGNTPLVEIKKIFKHPNVKILAKLQGQNPGGSVKDRPAYNMIKQALARGDIKPGVKLIQPTSGNTGIALAMIACIFNLDIQLVMPQNSTAQRIQTMQAYGAKVILTSAQGGIQGSRDYAQAQVAKGGYKMLNQFGNMDNPMAHYKTTGPQIWRDTNGTVTHFVSSMGTTGTIMGTSMFLKQKNEKVQIVGVQPGQGAKIPGIRRWTPEYLPTIFNKQRVDQTIDVTQQQSLVMMRRLAKEQGIFSGMSSGGSMAAAVRLAQTLKQGVIVTIVCDRGDRYLSSGIFANQTKN